MPIQSVPNYRVEPILNSASLQWSSVLVPGSPEETVMWIVFMCVVLSSMFRTSAGVFFGMRQISELKSPMHRVQCIQCLRVPKNRSVCVHKNAKLLINQP